MIAAVCCPGPSLPTVWRSAPRHYHEVWTVNTGLRILGNSANWLAAGDLTVVQALVGRHRPMHGVLTLDDHIPLMSKDPGWGGMEWVAWSAVPLIGEHARRGRPLTWSVQSALCHAAQRGSTRIDLFGADGVASGTVIDCTGYRGEDRSADRWRREAADLDFTTALLLEHGTTVQRITA